MNIAIPTPGKVRRPVFRNFGGYYQFFIEQTEGLDALLELEDGRWMATSCPLFGLRLDPLFLRLLDADGNGRIISDEVRQAVRWLRDRLCPGDSWQTGQDFLPLSQIAVEQPAGARLAARARRCLEELGQPQAALISLEQVRHCRQQQLHSAFDGDGILPPETIEDPTAAQLARELISTLGGVTDAAGRPGIDAKQLNQFLQEAAAFLSWYDQGQLYPGLQTTEILPFGLETPALFQILNAVRDKVEEYFAQTLLVRFDPAMAARLESSGAARDQLDDTSPEAIHQWLRRAPLARLDPEGLLPLDDGINEAFRAELEALRSQLATRLFGVNCLSLTPAQWRQLCSRFTAYANWIQAKPLTALESLGADKLRTYLDTDLGALLRSLIDRDRAAASDMQELQELEKLLLFHRWLFVFLNNYVSFPYLFDPEQRAAFEMGRLVLEGRVFDFSLQVENRAMHANLAKNSGIFLLYLQVSGSRPEDSFELVVPVTRGGTQGYYVGRRGVFFTTDGRQLDAQIAQIIENPVSFWETMKMPLRHLREVIGRRFEQLSVMVQKEAETSVSAVGAQVETSVQTGLRHSTQATAAPPASSPIAPPEPTRTAGNLRDVMIGLGFLVAGLGTAFKLLTDTAYQLTNPRTLSVLVAIVAAFFLVLILVMGLSAWHRLRRRDLGVLLQACGWAINGRLRLTRPMSQIFTRHASLPPRARKQRRDLLVPLARKARQLMGVRSNAGQEGGD